MEILKFLLIVAVIAFAIVRQARKSKSGQPEKRPSAPASGNFNPMEAAPVKEEIAKPHRKASKQSKKTKANYMEPASEGARTTAPAPHSSEPEQATDTNFSIGSIEDARKAIIWSEILNRKY